MSKEDFYKLTPNEVLNTVERAGFIPTGEFTQLNSYENRVFDVRLENNERVIAKFYRPGRWSKETILEEHSFLNDIKTQDLPAVAPLLLSNNATLDIDSNIWFALWPKASGRMVDELLLPDLEKLGRTLARFHNVGASQKFQFRPTMNAGQYGWQNLQILKSRISPEVCGRYLNAATEILEFLDDQLDETQFIRIHGDCHRGNILKNDGFFFVDFDDCCMGPPVQDFWMLLADNENTPEGCEELESLLRGYLEFREFDLGDLALIPGMRGLRIIHYAAWIARRWEDPSFPRLFPQYTDYNYWASETETLESLARAILMRTYGPGNQ